MFNNDQPPVTFNAGADINHFAVRAGINRRTQLSDNINAFVALVKFVLYFSFYRPNPIYVKTSSGLANGYIFRRRLLLWEFPGALAFFSPYFTRH